MRGRLVSWFHIFQEELLLFFFYKLDLCRVEQRRADECDRDDSELLEASLVSFVRIHHQTRFHLGREGIEVRSLSSCLWHV